MPVNDLIQFRKGLSSEWITTNPVLASGEPGYDLTNSILKVGDGTNTWTDLPLTASSEIYVYAKNTTTGTLYKGQAVYINGAIGANPTIDLAIASGEATSSKTLGLLKQNLAVNEFGYVVAEGVLDSVDTDGAISAGDPIWLSATTPGGVVYGLANKPYAPNHMVFLGYVLRKQLNNGKVYIKVQNGYELQELHNVATNGVTNGQFLQYNSSSGLWVPSSSGNFSTLQVNETGVSLSGHTHTSSQITDFNSSVSGLLPTISNIGDNRILTNTGSSVGINAESNLTFDGSLLNVSGSGSFSSNLNLSNQTASTIASFDASKNVVSLATATYPSLTELSYVKGVTSAIQTQIDSKAATSTTITAGSGLANGGSLAANRTIDVGQGDGITVNADTVAVDSTVVRTTGTQTITGNKIISVSTGVGLRITNTGSSDSFVVEDDTNPDTSPFVINNTGYVGIGKTSPSYNLDIVGTGYFSQNILINGTGVSISGHTHVVNDITDFSSGVANQVDTVLVAGSGIGFSYDNLNDQLTVSVSGTGHFNYLTFDSFSEKLLAIGNSSTAKTISLTNGTVQTCTLTGNCVFTMPALVAGQSFTLFLNTGSGNYTASFSGVKWSYNTSPTITTESNKIDIISFISDGSYWYGSYSQSY